MGLISKIKSIFGGDVIGLDIGDDLIKIVKVDTKGDKLVLSNLAVGETPVEAVEEGELKEVDILGSKLKSLLEENDFEAQKVVTAISGEEVIIRTVEVPSMPQDELLEAAKWEAEEQIPIPVEEMILDYEILKRNNDGSYDLMLVAVNREMVDRYLELFEMLDLEPEAIEIEPLAAIRSIKHLYPEQTIALMDMGAETTDVSVFDKGRLLFTRTVGIAGKNITQEIMDNYEMELEEAKEYKKNNNLFGDMNLNVIIRNLTTAIYRSLDYFEVNYKNHDIEKLILSGGGSKLTGFDTHLANEFGIEVERLNLLSSMEVNTEKVSKKYLSEIAPLLGVSIGLALRKEEEDDKSIAS